MTRAFRRTAALSLLLLAACATALPSPVAWTSTHAAADEAIARALEPVIAEAALAVEEFFGAPFPRTFLVAIAPDRAAFDASFPPEWGVGKTACWMVASGVAERLVLLSPRVWRTQACEHDPDDARHVRNLLAHELVHVYHGQHSASPDFIEVVGLDWFVEGLATHASGQLDSGEVASARAALAAQQGPERLADAWTGKYRYGVAGSLVAFLDGEFGRQRLVEMLAATTPDQLFALLGTSEAALLARWRAWVLAQ